MSYNQSDEFREATIEFGKLLSEEEMQIARFFWREGRASIAEQMESIEVEKLKRKEQE